MHFLVELTLGQSSIYPRVINQVKISLFVRRILSNE